MMRRALAILVLMFVLPGLGASLFLAGCGSSTASEYEREVAEINEAAAEGLEESLQLLAEEEYEEEEARTEAVVTALEEAVTVIGVALEELEEVKVPAGKEDLHRGLIAFYHANLAAYEEYMSALEPGGEDTEAEGHGEEEGAGPHEEEAPQGEEVPHEEEEPAESGGH